MKDAYLSGSISNSSAWRSCRARSLVRSSKGIGFPDCDRPQLSISRCQEPVETVPLDLFGRMDSGTCISSTLCGLRRVNPHRSVWEAYVVEKTRVVSRDICSDLPLLRRSQEGEGRTEG